MTGVKMDDAKQLTLLFLLLTAIALAVLASAVWITFDGFSVQTSNTYIHIFEDMSWVIKIVGCTPFGLCQD